ncbi:MAG: hypothetical protein ACYCUM_04855 [Solirubrobacteraceae bacterium]
MSRLRRVRLGEAVALAGAICIAIALALPWYGGAAGAPGADSAGRLGAWSTFGAGIVLLLIAATLAVALVLANVFERTTAVPVAAAVWTTLFGVVASVCALIRVLERPHGATGLQTGAWLALVGALATMVGGWLSMRDERPSLYEPLGPIEPRKPPV